MSVRHAIEVNKNASKATRLPVREELAAGRFNRDCLAHISRYLYIAEDILRVRALLKRPLRIIDIGCGDIYIALALNRTNRLPGHVIVEEYCGLDIDPQVIEMAEKRKPGAFPVILHCADVTDGALSSFQDSSFDIALCLEVIEHIKPEFVLPLFVAVRRLSDRSYISTPNRIGPRRIAKDHIKEWNYTALNQLITTAGLTILHEIGVNSDLTLVERLAKENDSLSKLYRYFKGKVDKTFLALIMAKCIGNQATNILRVCA